MNEILEAKKLGVSVEELRIASSYDLKNLPFCSTLVEAK